MCKCSTFLTSLLFHFKNVKYFIKLHHSKKNLHLRSLSMAARQANLNSEKGPSCDSKALENLIKKLNNLPKQYLPYTKKPKRQQSINPTEDTTPNLPKQYLPYSKKPKRQQSKNPTEDTTPIARRTRNQVCNISNNDGWLTKKVAAKQATAKDPKYEKLDVKVIKVKQSSKENKKVLKKCPSKNESKSSMKQSSLDEFLTRTPKSKTTKKNKFPRSESSDSFDLPCFETRRKSKKRNRSSVVKYGVSIPTVEEILQDQKDLEQYRNKVDSFQPLEDSTFELPFCTKELNKPTEFQEKLLDCEHLTFREITDAFNDNFSYIFDILHGKIFNERHKRYHDRNKKEFTLSPNNLSYNTSMIVFNFEQKEHMLTLLKEKFDPEDNLTRYFFQVLLPELCLKIFMDTHKMTYKQAVHYLEKRPLT